MGVLPLPFGTICVVLMLLPGQNQSSLIHFSGQKPLYVALGETLVLETQINRTARTFSKVTWERHTEKPTNRRVRIAEFPPSTSDSDPRITLDMQGMSLKVTEFRKEDCGIYTVRVTENNGNQVSAKRIVREAEVPPQLSISLLCDVSREREQWDRPAFQWLVDGEVVSNKTANLSADGQQLFPSGIHGRNYTCVVTSSQGRSTATYITSDLMSGANSLYTGWIAKIVFLLLGLLISLV
ncbi:uncharacterized protein LOC108919102 [Scleropages formosus]|uniref:uncharacterized protein LOC108919102 n=1 Tax=Scleropages formosus TaxID=113540 RepID=UPI0008780267|nr:uncharacterized protein LOC108919102 [Scleropages formosus]XP_018582391.1 uncharacterized protein LOC108919102 [Scleropages formosus]